MRWNFEAAWKKNFKLLSKKHRFNFSDISEIFRLNIMVTIQILFPSVSFETKSNRWDFNSCAAKQLLIELPPHFVSEFKSEETIFKFKCWDASFCSTGLPLSSTWWIRLTFSSHCCLSSNQHNWLSSAFSIIVFLNVKHCAPPPLCIASLKCCN